MAVPVLEHPIEPPEKLIKVQIVEKESELVISEISVKNIKSLISNLFELLKLRNEENNVYLIVNRSRILDTKLINSGTKFVLSSKCKTNLVKLYLDSV